VQLGVEDSYGHLAPNLVKIGGEKIEHFTTRPEQVYIAVGIKIRFGLDGPGIDPVGRQIFGTDPDLH
jgi:hypothetical protein